MRLAVSRSALALAAGLAGGLSAAPALAQSLGTLAKQYECTSTPVVVEGTELYKCATPKGMSYFSGPPTGPSPNGNTKKGTATAPHVGKSSPGSFPRVDSAT